MHKIHFPNVLCISGHEQANLDLTIRFSYSGLELRTSDKRIALVDGELVTSNRLISVSGGPQTNSVGILPGASSISETDCVVSLLQKWE